MNPVASQAGSRGLAGRLKELREARFPGVVITQRTLGRALGGSKPLSAPLISSWEKGTAIPSPIWIARYSVLFATDRSIEGDSVRLLRDTELTPAERTARDELRRELAALRDAAVRRQEAEQPEDPRMALGGTWYFRDGKPVRIVTTELPRDQWHTEATPTHPTLAYGELHSFGAIDALFEVWGHIRAANPHLDVQVRKTADLDRDDLSAHLVVVGGTDWNPLMRRIQEEKLSLPVRLQSTGDDPARAYFEVGADDSAKQFYAELSDKRELIADVGQFLRVPSPYNRSRTLTVCTGLFSLGTFGAVRTLTDYRFRDRNEQYLQERFAGADSYSILMRIDVLNGHEVVTPDWTEPANRLYEWPE